MDLLILAYYSAAGSAAKWVLDNWGAKAAVGPAGYMASWYTDNAINSLFELAAQGTDNAGINGMAIYHTEELLTETSELLKEVETYMFISIYEASDIRYEKMVCWVLLKVSILYLESGLQWTSLIITK